jgi:hypothetical protein
MVPSVLTKAGLTPSLAALGDLHDVIGDTEPAENKLHEERLAPWGPDGSR